MSTNRVTAVDSRIVDVIANGSLSITTDGISSFGTAYVVVPYTNFLFQVYYITGTGDAQKMKPVPWQEITFSGVGSVTEWHQAYTSIDTMSNETELLITVQQDIASVATYNYKFVIFRMGL